ncbi:hypothetical protein ACTQ1U_00035 [Thermoguttaceae bacterium LCP21S3_D4]|nr:hypothetical protein [Lachnospiraceae bacterium]MDD6303016.1 hypothetical protein [Lachnospiraceae bacterium]HCJ76274.1 hypothetical protein [Roseburia sp.]
MNNQWNQMPPNMPPQQRPPMPPNMPPQQGGPMPPNMQMQQGRPMPPNMQMQQRPPMPTNMPPRQGKMPRPELSPEDKKQADKLCIISMILMFAPIVIIFIKDIILGVMYDTGTEEFLYNIAGSYVLESTLTFLLIGCGIAALVLMILVRVKYPQSVFGKVLMWLYIVLAILVVVFIAVTIIACGLAFASCVRSCPG